MKKLVSIVVTACMLTGCGLPQFSADKTTEAPTTEQPVEKKVTQKKQVPRYDKKVVNGVTYINGILIVNKRISLPSTYNPGENKTARNALNEMFRDARKAGMHLVIRSGYRSYAAQKALYEQFVAKDGQQIAESYSAVPGQSEHQTGLAYDIGSRESAANKDIQFGVTPESKWLQKNAHKYGFIIRYGKDKTNITGFQYEPWHVRYVGKTHAERLYKLGQSLEEYLGLYKKPVAKDQAETKEKTRPAPATTEVPIAQPVVTTEEIAPVTLEQPATEAITLPEVTVEATTQTPSQNPQQFTEQPVLQQ